MSKPKSKVVLDVLRRAKHISAQMLGMSDDEVLNLPGWGVPKHIARTKALREWREEWTYPTPNGERRLYFVNTTLVEAAIDVPPAQQLAGEHMPYPDERPEPTRSRQAG